MIMQESLLSTFVVKCKLFHKNCGVIFISPIDRTPEEIEVVARWLQKIKIFRNLTFQLLESIASKVTYRLYNKDEVCNIILFLHYSYLKSVLPRRSR